MWNITTGIVMFVLLSIQESTEAIKSNNYVQRITKSLANMSQSILTLSSRERQNLRLTAITLYTTQSFWSPGSDGWLGDAPSSDAHSIATLSILQ